jgi:hypothetical protein
MFFQDGGSWRAGRRIDERMDEKNGLGIEAASGFEHWGLVLLLPRKNTYLGPAALCELIMFLCTGQLYQYAKVSTTAKVSPTV